MRCTDLLRSVTVGKGLQGTPRDVGSGAAGELLVRRALRGREWMLDGPPPSRGDARVAAW